MYAEFKRSNQAPVEVNVAVMREFPIGRNVLITKMSTTTTTTISISMNKPERLLGTIVGYTYNSVGEVLIDVLTVRQSSEAGVPDRQMFHVRNQMYMFQLI